VGAGSRHSPRADDGILEGPMAQEGDGFYLKQEAVLKRRLQRAPRVEGGTAFPGAGRPMRSPVLRGGGKGTRQITGD
jgi:hypothetical protein